MRNPVVNVECRPGSLEVAIVKDEKILVLLSQTLDYMRLAFWKVPDVTLVEDLNLVASELVNSTDGNLAFVYVAPLCDAMPVQFANAAFGQVLLGSGDVFARGQVGDDLLAHPAAGELAGFGVGEAPLEILD